MTEYLGAVEELRQIENKYDLMSVKIKGVSIWPHLRIYLVNKLFKNKEPQTISGNYKLVLNTLFAFNPLRALKKHDIWAFFATDDRKKIGGQYIESVCGYLSDLNTNTLLIEKASKVVGHYKKDVIPEKDVISTSWFYLLIFSYERILRFKKLKIENQDVINQVLLDYNIDFDYKYYIRVLLAQRRVARLFLGITKKPKLVFIEAPYVYMGFVWAFHEKGIPVVELQHGVLNEHHYAYNSIYRCGELRPDEICVFGIREHKYLTECNKNYADKITMVGSYILEKTDEFFTNDIFEEKRKMYHSIVVVSGQVEIEQVLLQFVEKIANKHQNLLFIYIPRDKNADISTNCTNVEIKRGVNIYEYLKWCDIHITRSSTTCLEAHYFKKPNVFFDYQKMATNYYGEVLKEENAAFYIDNEDQFDYVYKKIMSNNFKFLELYAHHSKDNIKDVICSYLN